jgi:hypothetical protein
MDSGLMSDVGQAPIKTIFDLYRGFVGNIYLLNITSHELIAMNAVY